MDRLIFTALNGINAQAAQRRALTNELANVGSTGFKRSFEIAQDSLKVAGPGFDARFLPKLRAMDIIDLRPGPRMVTGRALDIALDHQSVLGVEGKDGTLAFTRRGDLRLSPTGVLELPSGEAIRSEAGAIVTVPQGLSYNIAEDGTLYAIDPENPDQESVEIARLMLRDASEVALQRRSDGLFTPVVEQRLEGGDFVSGGQAPSVTAGALEGANVSAAATMVEMLEMARSFETQIRVIRESKDLDEQGASMMRLR